MFKREVWDGFKEIESKLRAGQYLCEILPEELKIDILVKKSGQGWGTNFEYIGAFFSPPNKVFMRDAQVVSIKGHINRNKYLEENESPPTLKNLYLTIRALEKFFPNFLDLAIPELRGRFDV